MQVKDINLLKHEVEKTFGRKVLSSTDCRYLCDDIYNHLKVRLSFNTLRRFFSLMESKSHPSFYTLDVLSNFCGFPSYSDFLAANSQAEESLTPEEDEPDFLNYLLLLFKRAETDDLIDFNYFNLIQKTVIFLERYPRVMDRFQRELAKTKKGQEFYFERFINKDHLQGYYGQGIKYYLQENHTAEAQVFGHALLCLRDFLCLRNDGVELHYNTVTQHRIESMRHVPLYSRYLAVCLFNDFICGSDPTPLLRKARQIYAANANAAQPHFFYFCFILAEALLLTKQFSEALFYIGEYLRHKKGFTHSFFDLQFRGAMMVFHASALVGTGEAVRAKQVLQEVNPSDFYPLSKRYITILYLVAKQELNKRRDDEEQILHLVEQTGFRRLWADPPVGTGPTGEVQPAMGKLGQVERQILG